MTLKIALLISGHTRSLSDTLPNLLKTIETLECEVFLHSWSVAEMSSPTWRQPEDFGSGRVLDEEFALLNPRAILIEESVPDLIRPIYKGSSEGDSSEFSGAHYMIYGMWACHNIFLDYCRNHDKKFDVVIRYRFDLICESPRAILLDCEAAVRDRNTIRMPRHNWATALGTFFDGVIAVNAKLYGEIMQALPLAFDSKCRQLNCGERFIPELLITEFMHDKSIKIEEMESSFKLIRRNGMVEQTFERGTGGPINYMKSQSTVYVILCKSNVLPNQSIISKAWKRHNSLLIRWATFLAYPIFTRIKSFFLNFHG